MGTFQLWRNAKSDFSFQGILHPQQITHDVVILKLFRKEARSYMKLKHSGLCVQAAGATLTNGQDETMHGITLETRIVTYVNGRIVTFYKYGDYYTEVEQDANAFASIISKNSFVTRATQRGVDMTNENQVAAFALEIQIHSGRVFHGIKTTPKKFLCHK